MTVKTSIPELYRTITAHHEHGELYPKSISRRMLLTSFALSLKVIFAWYWEQHALAVVALLVMTMSINFWRKPMMGFRRNIDIITAVAAVSFHFYQCALWMDRNTFSTLYTKAATAAMIYLMGKLCQLKKLLNTDSFFHCALHSYAIITGIWIYRELYHLQQQQI